MYENRLEDRRHGKVMCNNCKIKKMESFKYLTKQNNDRQMLKRDLQKE
jgi:hypothetical protein